MSRELGDDRAVHDDLELFGHGREDLVLALLGPVLLDPAVGHVVVVVVLELVAGELDHLEYGVFAPLLDQSLEKRVAVAVHLGGKLLTHRHFLGDAGAWADVGADSAVEAEVLEEGSVA